MNHRARLTALLLAAFLATGAQWDVLQTVAWARMFVSYSRSMTLWQAARQTFNGEMCGVCRAVDTAKQSEQKAAPIGGKLDTKLVLALQPVPVFVTPITGAGEWRPSEPSGSDALRGAPPTPPPRV